MPAYYGNFVVPTMLAQPSDLAEWTLTNSPANAIVLLRSATSLVLEATRQAYYDVDPETGLATDAQISGALLQATVIQAAAWAALDYDPLTGGVVTAGVESSTKMLSSTIVFADAAAAAESRTAAVAGLVPEALRVLELNNLLIPNPWTFG
jgi:hypothetical protein